MTSFHKITLGTEQNIYYVTFYETSKRRIHFFIFEDWIEYNLKQIVEITILLYFSLQLELMLFMCVTYINIHVCCINQFFSIRKINNFQKKTTWNS